ncbi:MAG: acetyl-CoA carboxylase, biotin carboxyl carrier protein [Rhodopirellula sp. TMED11]|nr:MAG: acetyl-CoA carboxylase, biotin carboxyl carrier protein [Rhodopirellula sp. TMED11]
MPSKTEKPNANFDVSANLLKKLAETMGNAGLSEIEYVDGERSLRLSRATQAPVVAAAPAAAPMMAPMAAPTAATMPAAAPAPAPAATPAAEPASSVKTIDSPMVGTVYLAPEPGAGNFVNVGDEIKEGDTLMIIEAMKVMNHLPSTQSGIVRRVLVADGEPVEFGQPLIELA